MPQNLLPSGGELQLFENCFAKEESDHFLQKLTTEIHWKHEPIKMFGRSVMQPRLTAMYGEPGVHYAYSGIDMQAAPWTDTLKAILLKVSSLANATFNIALLNLYRDGNDSMGWHRDNERSLGKHPTIASVSLGATRDFQVRRYKEKDNLMTLPLSHGSTLLMKGDMQSLWEHQVPKTKKQVAARINITFRNVE